MIPVANTILVATAASMLTVVVPLSDLVDMVSLGALTGIHRRVYRGDHPARV